MKEADIRSFFEWALILSPFDYLRASAWPGTESIALKYRFHYPCAHISPTELEVVISSDGDVENVG